MSICYDTFRIVLRIGGHCGHTNAFVLLLLNPAIPDLSIPELLQRVENEKENAMSVSTSQKKGSYTWVK